MSAVADVAASIVAAGAPLLFIDTCSLLDIVRGQRDAFTRDQATAAVTIIDLIEAGKLSLVLPEQITNEMADNFQGVQKDGTKSIRALNDRGAPDARNHDGVRRNRAGDRPPGAR